MRIDPRLLNWGLFFILVGAIPLAVRQGAISEASVERWWSLWPLLLVAAGVGLLLRRTPLNFAGGLLSAATLGVMAGGLLATGFTVPPFAGCGDERGAVAFPTREGTFDGNGDVSIELNCGDLTVVSGGGSGWRVEGADDDGTGPSVESTSSSLRVRSVDDREPFAFLGKRDIWTITVPGSAGLDIDITVNAGSGRVDLADGEFGLLSMDLNAGSTTIDAGDVASLDRVDLSVNAGSAKITLPERDLSATMTVNAGSISICTPPDAGLRIRTNDNITAGNNFGQRGLTKSGSTWETPGFGAADTQLEIDAEANAGSVNLNPEGGCGA
jgi:hypothetical protein